MQLTANELTWETGVPWVRIPASPFFAKQKRRISPSKIAKAILEGETLRIV